jgi:hypothetical protein
VTKIALVGYGNVARALARLLKKKRARFPFLITGIHTARHGTIISPKGTPLEPSFGSPAKSVGEFLEHSGAEIAVELTTLNPATGEPATSHIRAAFERGMHVVTANKGPIAHGYAALRDEAAARRLQLRFESTVMDGAPVCNRSNWALAVGYVLVQPDARLLTCPVGCARLIKGTYERFDVSIEMPEPLDSIGERPACGRVFVQEFLSFLPNHLWALQSNRPIGAQAGKYHRDGEREHDQRKYQCEVLQPLAVFEVCLCSICTLLFFPEQLTGGQRVFHDRP